MFFFQQCWSKRLTILHLKDEPLFFFWQALPYIIEGFRILPLVTFPLVYFAGGSENWVAIGVLIFFVMLFMLLIISTLRTGNENPGCLEKVTRWDVVKSKRMSRWVWCLQPKLVMRRGFLLLARQRFFEDKGNWKVFDLIELSSLQWHPGSDPRHEWYSFIFWS